MKAPIEHGRRPAAPGDLSDGGALPPVASDHITPTREIERALGQTIESALDLSNWEEGTGLKSLGNVQKKLATQVHKQKDFFRKLRERLLPNLKSLTNAPVGAGVYRAKDSDLQLARRNVLLSGNTTAVRGASVGHDSIAASLVSVGICLTRYDGQSRSWRTTFFRHDCDVSLSDPMDEIRAMLNEQHKRSRGPGVVDGISRLMRRAFQSAAERKSLLERGGHGWRFGYGLPAPYDLLTGSGSMELLDAILPVLDELLLKEKKWVFVPESTTNFALASLASALPPGHFAIIQKARPTFESIVANGHYDNLHQQRVQQFVDRAGEELVIGAFRATAFSPGQIFFAHVENAIHAGLIAMADAELQPHRGFPLLLELAGVSAKVGLGVDAFQGMIESTYAREGAGSLYSSGGVILPQFGE